MRRVPIDVKPFILDTVRRWSATAECHWCVDAPLRGVLMADEERLGYTLDALIENAVKFTREGGCIGAWSRPASGA